ncbi:hypothetical protein BASA81_006102 [Batrachochytrium salamandrivorans]|nr:hypothetical protein BASA81_006102 [Batrachochytrium salamandrivorans]
MTSCYEVNDSLAGRGCIASRRVARGETVLVVPSPLVFASTEPEMGMCEVCGELNTEEGAAGRLCCRHSHLPQPVWFGALDRLLELVDFTDLCLSFAEISMAVKFVCLMADQRADMVEAYNVLEANFDSIPALRYPEQREQLESVLAVLETKVLVEELALIGNVLNVHVDLKRVLAVQWTNTFMVSAWDVIGEQQIDYGLALYPPVVCMFNHSCHPNAARSRPLGSVKGDQQSGLGIAFVALRDIDKGEEICIRYHEGSQREIHSAFGFWCNCSRCREPTAKAQQPCAFDCPHCPAGLLTSNAQGSFACNSCLGEIALSALEPAQQRQLKRLI